MRENRVKCLRHEDGLARAGFYGAFMAMEHSGFDCIW
jgi:hypothetical protein